MEKKQFFKYLTSSVITAVAEEGLFVLLTFLLSTCLGSFMLTILPAAVARFGSATLNFTINRKWVFPNSGPVKRTLWRFYLQQLPVSLAQILLTYGVYSWFHIGEEQVLLRGGIFACVMPVIFILNFLGQKLWVFAKPTNKG